MDVEFLPQYHPRDLNRRKSVDFIIFILDVRVNISGSPTEISFYW